MAELTVESGPLRGRSVSFTEEDTVLVGSTDGAFLRLELPGVADRHLVIKALKNGGYGAKQLDGGFLINGQRTEAARLSQGDLIEIGNIRIRFGKAPTPTQIPSNSRRDAHPAPEIEGYRLIEILGQGGNGTVYRAEQLSLHREVALKVLNKAMTENPEFVGRFVAEARAAARLSHPNVVQVFDVGHDGDTYYLSMEIMEHGSLEDLVKRDGRIPVDACLGHMIDAAKGLAYAESMRIVHRDIKPDNLMIDGHGVVKIADLGLAMSDDAEQGKIVGTPHFMSPEQVLNKPVDNRSDLYSLGCTFFRLVTGRNLFPKKTTKEILTAQVKSEPESADEVQPDIPASVAAVIDQLVEKDPDDRFQGADELVEDLKSVLHPPARRGLLIGIACLVLLGAGYAIYWGMTRGERIITVPGENSGDAEKIKQKLRETEAEKDLLRVLQNVDNAAPLVLAKRLDEFSQDQKYADTSASAEAVTKAKQLRKEEAARIAAAKARETKIATEKTKLEERLGGLIEAGDFRAAAKALKPTDVPGEILATPEIQTVLRSMADRLRDAGDKRMDAMQAEVDKAIQDRSPAAAEKALAAIQDVLDRQKPTAWPDAAFSNRKAALSSVKSSETALRALRKDVLSTQETSAWAQLVRNTVGTDGVLARANRLELDAALTQSTETTTALKERKAEPTAANLTAVVAAAKNYDTAFRAAAAGGKLTVPFEVDGAVTKVPVVGFASSGDQSGLRVEVPKGEGTEPHTIPLSDLRGERMLQMFPAVEEAPDQRLAFLALQLLWEHLDAARKYMGTLDPKDPASGTGEHRYKLGVGNLNTVLADLDKVSPPWGDFLKAELRAARELSRGLRAFSKRQYTNSQGYLENLAKRFDGTLAVRMVE